MKVKFTITFDANIPGVNNELAVSEAIKEINWQEVQRVAPNSNSPEYDIYIEKSKVLKVICGEES